MHQPPTPPPLRNEGPSHHCGLRHHWERNTQLLAKHLFLAFCTLGELLTLASTSQWLREMRLPARCPHILVHALAPYTHLQATLQEGANLLSVHISPKATFRFHEWMTAFSACTALHTLRFEAREKLETFDGPPPNSRLIGQERPADIALYLQKQARLRTLVCPHFNTGLTWLPIDTMVDAFPYVFLSPCMMLVCV